MNHLMYRMYGHKVSQVSEILPSINVNLSTNVLFKRTCPPIRIRQQHLRTFKQCKPFWIRLYWCKYPKCKLWGSKLKQCYLGWWKKMWVKFHWKVQQWINMENKLGFFFRNQIWHIGGLMILFYLGCQLVDFKNNSNIFLGISAKSWFLFSMMTPLFLYWTRRL